MEPECSASFSKKLTTGQHPEPYASSHASGPIPYNTKCFSIISLRILKFTSPSLPFRYSPKTMSVYCISSLDTLSASLIVFGYITLITVSKKYNLRSTVSYAFVEF